MAEHHLRQFFVQPQLTTCFQILGTDQFRSALRQPVAIHTGHPLPGLAHQLMADPQGQCDIFGLHPAPQIMPPGFEMIDPGENGVLIAAQFCHSEFTVPAVIHQSQHWYFPPGRFTRLAILQNAAQRIMAVSKSIGFHGHDFAHGALDSEPPAIHCRADPFNNDAFAPIDRSLDEIRFWRGNRGNGRDWSGFYLRRDRSFALRCDWRRRGDRGRRLAGASCSLYGFVSGPFLVIRHGLSGHTGYPRWAGMDFRWFSFIKATAPSIQRFVWSLIFGAGTLIP